MFHSPFVGIGLAFDAGSSPGKLEGVLAPSGRALPRGGLTVIDIVAPASIRHLFKARGHARALGG